MVGMVDPQTMSSDALPGSDLVAAGLADLHHGRETIEAMLVAAAADRLGRLGVAVPKSVPDDPEGRLYALIEAQVGPRRAHGRYKALRRRMLSYLRSASHAPVPCASPMRQSPDATRVRAFLEAFAQTATEPTTVYLVGGATAVTVGWRASTSDVDIGLA